MKYIKYLALICYISSCQHTSIKQPNKVNDSLTVNELKKDGTNISDFILDSNSSYNTQEVKEINLKELYIELSINI